jgi:hypothetical protein
LFNTQALFNTKARIAAPVNAPQAGLPQAKGACRAGQATAVSPKDARELSPQ